MFKKGIALMLSVLLLVGAPPVNAMTTQKRNFEVENSHVKSVYENLNERKSSKYTQESNKQKDMLRLNTSGLSKKDKALLEDEFSIIAEISDSNNDFEVILREETDKISTAILYDKTEDMYTLIEMNLDREDILYIVDGVPFVIAYEGENIVMYSESGEKLMLSETTYITEPPFKLSYSNIDNSTNIDASDNSIVSYAFGPMKGPFYKTNKSLVEVLGIVGTAGTVASYKIKHPILGVVSGVTGIIGFVGDKVYKTLYIKYYQQYDYSNPNAAYVRETQDWYNYNSHTGFIKRFVHEFWGGNPN